MTNPRTMLTDSAALLLLAVVVGGVVGGPEFALGTAASGLVAWLNLVAMSVLTSRLTRSVAAGRSAAAAIGVMFLKFAAVLAAFIYLVTTFPPLSVVAGLGTAVMAMSVRPMLGVLEDVDDSEIVASGSQS